MNFTYETQGAITYLVCELAPTEQIDSLTLGMLTNNHIAGFAPVLYTEMNGQRYLKYNISAKISVDQFFSGTMTKQRALTAFQNILNAICSADEYMIDPNCFSVASEHIFLNVSSCETALLCIPVISDKDINVEIASLFKKIMFSTQFDNSEDASFITQIITYINSGVAFSVYGLKDLVDKLQAGVPTGIQVPPVPQASASQQPTSVPSAPAVPVAAPASSFDSTITIDQMPAMLAQQQAQQPQSPIQVPSPAPQVHVSAPPAPAPAVPAAPPVQPQTPVAGARPIGDGVPAQKNKTPFGMAKPQTPPAVPKPPVQNGPGFAIPGQVPTGVAKPPMPAAPVQKPPKQKVEAPAGDKKMTLFGLLSHYNKENAELYKKQKEEEKAKKAADATKAVPPAVAPIGVPGRPASVLGVANPAAQPFAQPQVRPQMQPVPVQNSFNETTVLSPIMAGGETTVLSADPAMPDPCLIRIKTGEKISINKPVFRIGKEKSYVDYFIADNTAISRSHANIHTENNEYFIEDTNSTNHTYINGVLINSNVKTKITSGDKVKFANEEFTFLV